MTDQQLAYLIDDPTWDAPFFKRLAANDTGNAVGKGHQGGMAIPKELRRYFPVLNAGITSAQSPTVDRSLMLELFDAGVFLGNCVSRYQFQTWGGTRPPESRITGNLGPLRNLAHRGDLLFVQRSRDRIDAFRLMRTSEVLRT